MNKKIFKKGDEIHFGVNPMNGFMSAEKPDVEEAISKLADKKLWRCNVCNDLYLGNNPPHECPTCHSIDAYVEIELFEFKKLIGI